MDRWSERGEARALLRPGEVRSILIAKLDHIGDFILAFDALIALRGAFPEARIEMLCAPWNEALARSLGLFDEVHTLAFFDKRSDGKQPTDRSHLWASLPTGHYDLAIDLRADPDTRVVLNHVHATYRAGFDCPGHEGTMVLAMPHYLPRDIHGNVGMHQSLLMLRLVRSVIDLFHRTDDVKSLLLGRVATPAAIDLSLARGRQLVVVNTSSGRMVKNWPFERFRNLVRWLAAEMGAVVLLIGGKDQADEAADIIAFCGSPHVISAAGTTSLGEAVNLVAQASMFIGNDSGMTHVAAKLDIPTVVLFSGIDPVVMWAAPGRQVTLLRAPVPCSPCHILHMEDCVGGHACMRNLSEGTVRASVRRILLSAPHYRGGVPDDVRGNASFKGWAGSRTVQKPQRYGENLHRYHAGGGELRIEPLLDGFVAGNAANRGDLNRFYFLLLVFDMLLKEQLQGDVAELGVYKGNTAGMLTDLARRLGARAYLLDTFEGFKPDDLAGVDADKAMTFADTSLERVQAVVGADAAASFVPGYFPATADRIPPDARFCLVHIDCDLYKPFKAALDFFYPRLVPGGFLILHDYSSLHWDGAERAVDEFFADKPESPVPVPDMAGTVVVRRLAADVGPFNNWYVQRASSGFANAWVHACDPENARFFGAGWAGPEGFGTWGVGPSHILRLLLNQPPAGGIEFSAESCAPLVGHRVRQSVDVLVAGRLLATWHYDPETNAGIRMAVIPHGVISVRDGLPYVEVEFRPSRFESPMTIDPAVRDDRELGMGLIRFRQRPL